MSRPESSPLVERGFFTAAALEAPAGAALVALNAERLDRLRAARDRLRLAEDDEALHDFRVALRRVRSLVRGYRRVARLTVPPRLTRDLRRLSRVTGVSRDLEVKLAWLQEVDDLRPRDVVGHRWFIKRLTAAKSRSDDRSGRRIEAAFFPLTTELERRLEQLAASDHRGQGSLAAETAVSLRDLLDTFARRLDVVDSIAKQDEAHGARIAGKKVRYLLEPLARVMPAAREIVERYKGIQEALGEMRDAHVLGEAIAAALEEAALERGRRVAERVRGGDRLDRPMLRRERRRDPMPGLMALASRVHARRERAWREVHTKWLARRAGLLLDPVRALAEELGGRGGEGLEIERKYLLNGRPNVLDDQPFLEIDQGYLPGERIQERVRRTRNGNEVKWYRALKSGSGLVRRETEEETSETIFEALWSLTEGRRVSKRRYRLAEGGVVWEIDDFQDRALVLAEVELGSVDQVTVIPDWLGPHLVREVTEDPDYQNANLAQ